MSSSKIIPRVLSLNSARPNLVKGILGPLSRGHHQIGVTVNAIPRSNSQAGSLVPSGSFIIRQMVKLGLVNYPQKCLPFTCDISRSRTFSNIPGETQPAESPRSQASTTFNFNSLVGLLKMSPKDQDVQRIQEALKELDESGCKLNTPTIICTIMDFYCRQGIVEKALHYKGLLAEYPAYYIEDYRLINLATLLVSKGLFDEAENLVSEHSPKYPIEDRGKGIWFNVFKLMVAYQNTGDIERARIMLDLLHKNGYYASGWPPTTHAGTLIRIHLQKNDIDGAVEEFMRTVEKYKCAPCLLMIFKELLAKSETDKVGKVVEAATQILGKAKVLFNLAQALIQLNNLTPALHILKTSAVRIPDRQLYGMLDRLVLAGKVDTIEELVNSLKELGDINKDILYYNLLRAYELDKNVEKALEAWSSMQKEGVEPSEHTLHLLGNFLTQNRQPVPFSFSETAGPYTFTDGSKNYDRVRKTVPGEQKRNFKDKESFQNEDQFDDSSPRSYSSFDRRTRR